MGKTRRIRTILYGDQKIAATELDLLHTPALQRLYDLHQLGLADRVFIDASHSRLHHVVGVLQQVENLVDAIIKNLEAHPERVLTYFCADRNKTIEAGELADYVQKRRSAVRLMGLLHDLTHSPFGHTLEDEIQLVQSKHDEPERQAKAFYRLLCQYVFWLIRDSGRDESVRGTWGSTSRYAGPNDEPKTLLARYLDSPDLLPPPEDAECMTLLASLAAKQLKHDTSARDTTREPRARELCRFLHDLHFAMHGLLYLDCMHKENPKDKEIPNDNVGFYAFDKLIRAILKKAGSPLLAEESFHPQRDAFLLDLIGNTICADLLDYAKRDSHFAGLKLDYDADRIVENFTLVSHPEKQGPFTPPLIRTAISIFSHKLRLDVPGELLNLLQVRFYLYQRVLFHPTKCIAGAMLGAALQFIGWKKLPEHLAFVGDAVFLYQVSEAARIVRDLLKKHIPQDSSLTGELSAPLIAYLDRIPSTGILLAAKKLIEDRVDQQVASIQSDLRAAIRLLDRLSARRYHRPIFRVLPGVPVGGKNITARDIAGVFRDSKTRSRIEKAIEEAAELPTGTVVIHCPNSEGPKKIAAMLMAMDNSSRAHKLRDIAQLNPSLFQKHQDAIQALEEMYASMWRLVVAVAPPFRAECDRINKFVGGVLHEEITEKVLGHRQKGMWSNDQLMSEELKNATAKKNVASGKEVVYIMDSRGNERSISANEFQIGQLAVKILKNNQTFQRFLDEQPAANGNDEQSGIPPSNEEVARLLGELLADRPVTVGAQQPVIIEQMPPESVKGPEIGDWFKSVEGRLKDRKTKKRFQEAQPRLRDVIQPLSPSERDRVFAKFAERLINQDNKTAANYVNADQIVRAVEDIIRELRRVEEVGKKPQFESKRLWD